MDKLDRVGYAVLIALLAGAVWVPFTLKYAKYQDLVKLRQEAMIEAQQRINADMQKACHCWFTDSRCRAPATKVVVCDMPEFMRQIP